MHHRCTTTPPTSLAAGAFKLTTQRDIRHLKRRLMACRGPHRTRYDSIYGASRRAAVSLFYARTWSVFRRHTDRPLTPGAFHLQDSALPGHLRLLFCISYLHDTKQTTLYNACSISQCVAKMVFEGMYVHHLLVELLASPVVADVTFDLAMTSLCSLP